MKFFQLHIFIALLTLISSSHACANELKLEADIWASINYHDWTERAENNSRKSGGLKKDFGYIRLSTLIKRGNISAFGFLDFENPHDGLRAGFQSNEELSSDFRVASKIAVSYLLDKNKNLSLYGQVYSYHIPADNFYDRNHVIGIKKSYKNFSNGVKIFEPFVGLHYESTSNLKLGFNGFTAGWSGQFPLDLFNTKFTLKSWHETEFARQEKFTTDVVFISPGSFESFDKTGHNGAIGIWKSLGDNKNRYLQPDIGIQYRYSDHKLGTAAGLDGVILTLKLQLSK